MDIEDWSKTLICIGKTGVNDDILFKNALITVTYEYIKKEITQDVKISKPTFYKQWKSYTEEEKKKVLFYKIYDLGIEYLNTLNIGAISKKRFIDICKGYTLSRMCNGSHWFKDCFTKEQKKKASNLKRKREDSVDLSNTDEFQNFLDTLSTLDNLQTPLEQPQPVKHAGKCLKSFPTYSPTYEEDKLSDIEEES